MELDLITHQELQQFKEEMLEGIKRLLIEQKYMRPQRKWLKSHEVRRLLAISPGTLQHLRVTGKLPFTKIGGIIFYEHKDVEQMLQDHKTI